MKKSFAILYEDDAIIVLNKSGHVLSVEDRYDPTRPNLRAMLLRRYGEIYLVHRLDMETSGVMVFARTKEAHSHLSMQFQNHEVKKLYHALCLAPQADEGTIEIGLAEDHKSKGKYIPSKIGKHAYSTFTVLKRLDRYALVEIGIKTGRTHQIRVHLKHIGAPLLTDRKYGLSDAFYLSEIKKIRLKKDQQEKALISRTSLHSYHLEFKHPVSNEIVLFNAPLHKDMKAVLFQLEKKMG